MRDQKTIKKDLSLIDGFVLNSTLNNHSKEQIRKDEDVAAKG